MELPSPSPTCPESRLCNPPTLGHGLLICEVAGEQELAYPVKTTVLLQTQASQRG